MLPEQVRFIKGFEVWAGAHQVHIREKISKQMRKDDDDNNKNYENNVEKPEWQTAQQVEFCPHMLSLASIKA